MKTCKTCTCWDGFGNDDEGPCRMHLGHVTGADDTCDEWTRRTGYIYVASPYTGTPDQEDDRLACVREYVIACIRNDETVYSPIAAMAAVRMCAYPPLPGTWDFWKRMCLDMLSQARELRVLRLDGWRESVGVAEEIKEANRLGISVVEVDYDE